MKIKRPSETTVKLLKMVALGVLLIGIGAAPSPRAIAHMFRELRMRDTPKNRKWIRRKLYALHEQRYVEISSDVYSLSEIGHRIVEENKLWEISIPVPKKWDGLWHIAVFDIPKERSAVRIAFVRHLQNLGLIYYQRSVWLHAYPCEEEVREIALFHDILPFVSFIKAVHLDGSRAFRKHFKLPPS